MFLLPGGYMYLTIIGDADNSKYFEQTGHLQDLALLPNLVNGDEPMGNGVTHAMYANSTLSTPAFN